MRSRDAESERRRHAVRRWFWCAWAVGLGAALVSTPMPGLAPPNSDVGFGTVVTLDKLVHVLAWGSVTLAGLAAARSNRQAVAVVVVGLALGAVLEVVQIYVPGRWPSVADALANLTGVSLAALLRWRVGGRLGPRLAGFFGVGRRRKREPR